MDGLKATILLKVDGSKVTGGLDDRTTAISLKAPKDEIRRNGRRKMTIYKKKKHEKRSDAFDQRRGQLASATCLLAFNEGYPKAINDTPFFRKIKNNNNNIKKLQLMIALHNQSVETDRSME